MGTDVTIYAQYTQILMTGLFDHEKWPTNNILSNGVLSSIGAGTGSHGLPKDQSAFSPLLVKSESSKTAAQRPLTETETVVNRSVIQPLSAKCTIQTQITGFFGKDQSVFSPLSVESKSSKTAAQKPLTENKSVINRLAIQPPSTKHTIQTQITDFFEQSSKKQSITRYYQA